MRGSAAAACSTCIATDFPYKFASTSNIVVRRAAACRFFFLAVSASVSRNPPAPASALPPPLLLMPSLCVDGFEGFCHEEILSCDTVTLSYTVSPRPSDSPPDSCALRRSCLVASSSSNIEVRRAAPFPVKHQMQISKKAFSGAWNVQNARFHERAHCQTTKTGQIRSSPHLSTQPPAPPCPQHTPPSEPPPAAVPASSSAQSW